MVSLAGLASGGSLLLGRDLVEMDPQEGHTVPGLAHRDGISSGWHDSLPEDGAGVAVVAGGRVNLHLFSGSTFSFLGWRNWMT